MLMTRTTWPILLLAVMLPLLGGASKVALAPGTAVAARTAGESCDTTAPHELPEALEDADEFINGSASVATGDLNRDWDVLLSRLRSQTTLAQSSPPPKHF
jgi:hypothetical protein